MRRRAMVAAAGLIGVLALGACSHSSGSGTNGAGGVLAPAPAESAANGVAGGVSIGAPAASRAAGAGSAPGAGSGTGDGTGTGNDAVSDVALDSGAKIRTAQMTVAIAGAADVSGKADQAGAIALGAGGEVDADNRTSGRFASAVLVLRVPPDSLPSVLHELSQLGSEKSRSLSTTDVTERVADVNSRVASAREAIVRLRTLYARATKVPDIIEVESDLSGREASLESLEAQQRSLARQTALATITLTLQTAPKVVARPKPKHHTSPGGFVGGIKRGWHGFAAAAGWVAGAIGTVLPFAALVVLLAIAGRLAWGRRPRRTAPAP